MILIGKLLYFQYMYYVIIHWENASINCIAQQKKDISWTESATGISMQIFEQKLSAIKFNETRFN